MHVGRSSRLCRNHLPLLGDERVHAPTIPHQQQKVLPFHTAVLARVRFLLSRRGKYEKNKNYAGTAGLRRRRRRRRCEKRSERSGWLVAPRGTCSRSPSTPTSKSKATSTSARGASLPGRGEAKFRDLERALGRVFGTAVHSGGGAAVGRCCSSAVGSSGARQRCKSTLQHQVK